MYNTTCVWLWTRLHETTAPSSAKLHSIQAFFCLHQLQPCETHIPYKSHKSHQVTSSHIKSCPQEHCKPQSQNRFGQIWSEQKWLTSQKVSPDDPGGVICWLKTGQKWFKFSKTASRPSSFSGNGSFCGTTAFGGSTTFRGKNLKQLKQLKQSAIAAKTGFHQRGKILCLCGFEWNVMHVFASNEFASICQDMQEPNKFQGVCIPGPA